MNGQLALDPLAGSQHADFPPMACTLCAACRFAPSATFRKSGYGEGPGYTVACGNRDCPSRPSIFCSDAIQAGREWNDWMLFIAQNPESKQ